MKGIKRSKLMLVISVVSLLALSEAAYGLVRPSGTPVVTKKVTQTTVTTGCPGGVCPRKVTPQATGGCPGGVCPIQSKEQRAINTRLGQIQFKVIQFLKQQPSERQATLAKLKEDADALLKDIEQLGTSAK
jgi:hypothetical protein